MSNANTNTQSNTKSTAWQIIGRLVTAAIVLGITAFFTPGFRISNFWALAMAAIVLTVIDYLITKFTGLHASSFGKGFVGFVLSAVVLYVTQYFVAGYHQFFQEHEIQPVSVSALGKRRVEAGKYLDLQH